MNVIFSTYIFTEVSTSQIKEGYIFENVEQLNKQSRHKGEISKNPKQHIEIACRYV